MSSHDQSKMDDETRTTVKYSTADLVKFGLKMPLNELTIALQTLIWDETSPIDPVRPGGGILLFGPPNCGGDHLLDTVLDQIHSVQKFPLKWEALKHRSKPDYVKNLFQQARDAKRAVIVIESFNDLLFSLHCREQVLKEVYNLVTTVRENVFIVVHATEPWTIGDKILMLFKTKIHIPAPTEDARAKLLNIFLDEVRTENELKKAASISDPNLKSIAELPSMRKATWKDLHDCAVDSFNHAVRNYFGLSSDQDLDLINLDPGEEDVMKSSLVIAPDHLRAAVGQMKIKNSSCNELEDLKKFKERWGIKEYSNFKVPVDYYVCEKNDKQKEKGGWESFLGFFAEALELCF